MLSKVSAAFSTPICSKFLQIDNQPIEEYCYDLINGLASKPGGWQSGMLELTDSKLQPLVEQVKEMIKEVSDHYFIQKPYQLELDNAWVNINQPGLEQLPNNRSHLHPEYFFSFVYYVKADPGAGFINLANPTPLLEYALPDLACSGFGPFNTSRISIAPEAHKLIGFPSWISHSVDPNLSNSNRISIAFNAKLAKY
jgi:uncharacterized protein (TIGR02466 family)